MTRFLFALLLAGCATSHERSLDVGPATDAAPAVHDTATDARPPTDVGPPVVCGPNVCRPGEICCDVECGVCAFAAECVDFGCLDGP